MPKYVDAEALAERFRDMAEFADGIQAVALREAAEAAEDMPEADVRQVLSGEWQRITRVMYPNGTCRYLRCPFCGFETDNEARPRIESWKFCPGCGNKCSGGSIDEKNRAVRVGDSFLYTAKPENPGRNAEHYADPTAYRAIRNIEKGGEK